MDRLMTAREAADYLRMNFQTVYRLAQVGKLPASKVGGQWRFKKELLDEWLRAQAHANTNHTHQVVGGVRSILIVDDDPAVRDSFVEILSQMGLQVDTAANGEAALDRVRHQHYDLVFLDVLMPGLSGVDTLKGLREMDPGVQVVIITGYPEHHLVADALELGPVVALRKPVLVRDIRRALALLSRS